MNIKIFNRRMIPLDELESKGGFTAMINDFCDHVDVVDICILSVDKIVVKYNNLSAEYWKPSKNERNAGRKTIITESMKEAVKQYRLDGVGYREISDLMGISVGLAHKIYNS